MDRINFDGRKSPARRLDVEQTGRCEVGVFEPFGKTSVTFARKIDDPFLVNTLEGLHAGKPGDWLAIGARGEMYPIAAEVFEATYVPASDTPRPHEFEDRGGMDDDGKPDWFCPRCWGGRNELADSPCRGDARILELVKAGAERRDKVWREKLGTVPHG